MGYCPKCQCDEVRVHGTRIHIDYVKRWRFFGRIVPRTMIRAFEVSCGECLFAFTVRPGRIIEAPVQQAFNQLAALKNGQPQQLDEEKPAPPPRNVARPASDPRMKQRR